MRSHRSRDHLLAATLIGAGLLVLADWLSGVIIYPYQVPVGLFAALIGGLAHGNIDQGYIP